MDGLVFDGALDPTLAWTLHLFLAAVMARAGFAKLRAPEDFSRALREYALLPEAAVRGSAAALLTLECLLVPALLLPSTASIASYGAALLMALYGAAISINLTRGRRDIDCGCSGPLAHQPLHEWLVARNLGYLLLAGIGVLPTTGRVLGALDVFTVCLATAGLLTVALSIDGLAAAAARTRLPEGSR